LIDEVAADDSVAVLHEGRRRAQGSLSEVLAETGAADIGAAFAALTQTGPTGQAPAGDTT
jgi:ABC-2 type transport system ATP-binding protein